MATRKSTRAVSAQAKKAVKEAILERIPVKDVVLLDTAGVSSMYANDGGIIIAM